MIKLLGTLFGFKGINADINPTASEGPETRTGIVADLTDGNHILVKDGYIHKAPGISYLNGNGAPLGMSTYQRIQDITVHILPNGQKSLMVMTPKRLYSLASNGNFNQVGSPDFNMDEFVTSAPIIDRLYFAGLGSGRIYYWDGYSLNECDYSARMITSWMNHLFLIRPIINGVEGRRDIQWSYPGNPNLWPEESRLTIATGDRIVRAVPMDDIMVVYFKGAIYRLYLIDESSGFGAVPICDNIGLEAPGAVAQAPGIQFFLSREGVFALRGSSAPSPLSWGRFNKFVVDCIDPLYLSKSVLRYFPRSGYLYMLFPSVGSQYNNTLLVFDVNSGNLVSKREFGSLLQDIVGISCISEIDPGVVGVSGITGNRDIPVFGSENGRLAVEDYSVRTVFGTGVHSWFRLQPTKFYNFQLFKRLLQVELMGSFNEDTAFNLIVSPLGFIDGIHETLYSGGVLTDTLERYIFYTDQYGKEFTLEVEDNGHVEPGADFTIQNVLCKGFHRTDK